MSKMELKATLCALLVFLTYSQTQAGRRYLTTGSSFNQVNYSKHVLGIPLVAFLIASLMFL